MKTWYAIALVALAGVGCSSSSGGGGGSCKSVAPCGGNVVGTWTIVDACASGGTSTGSVPGCAGATIQEGSSSASGTIAFNSDMTYSLALTESSSATLTIPSSCLSAGGASVTCGELQSSLSTTTAEQDAGAETYTCSSAGSGCACTVSIPAESTNEMGTYTVSGSTLTTTATTTSDVTTLDFCVQGNTLYATSGSAGTSVEFVATR